MQPPPRFLTPAVAFACALSLTLSLPVPARTQESAASQSETTVPTLKLDAFITDDKGRFVGELKAEELRLFVNGTERKVASVELEEHPVVYGLVVDNSGSLTSLLGAVVITAQGFVANNRPGDETFVVRFVASDDIKLMQDFTSDADALQGGIAGMYIEGGQTALIDGLYFSAEHMLKNRPREEGRRRALILISDGENRKSKYKTEQLLELLRGSGIQVFCIGFVGKLENAQRLTSKSKRALAVGLLNRLADETGGLAFFPEKTDDLQAAFGEIVRHLRAQHVVRFAPDAGLRPETVSKVELKVAAGAGRRKRRAVTGLPVTSAADRAAEKK